MTGGPTAAPRPWDVLLVGGASGVGKSQVGPALASVFGAAFTAVDDVHAVLERMTTPEQYPVLHMWRLHPDQVLALDDDGMLAHTLEYASVVTQALEPVIANHLEEHTPVVLEGDFVLPALATMSEYGGFPAEGRIRGLFVYEKDEAQIARNFHAREGEEQPRRARASWRYSEWLREECARLGVPAIPARPWNTVVKRAVESVA